jgi:hypothetical protein
MLHRCRPFVALLANLALAHAIWIGSGLSCAMPEVSGMQASAMAGMPMPSAMTATNMRGDASQHSPGTPTHQQVPCRFPWVPDGCQAATSCVALAIRSPVQVPRATDGAPAVVATLRVLMPPSHGLSLEPPPPRA